MTERLMSAVRVEVRVGGGAKVVEEGDSTKEIAEDLIQTRLTALFVDTELVEAFFEHYKRRWVSSQNRDEFTTLFYSMLQGIADAQASLIRVYFSICHKIYQAKSNSNQEEIDQANEVRAQFLSSHSDFFPEANNPELQLFIEMLRVISETWVDN